MKNVHQLRDIIDTMYNTAAEILEGKRRALKDGNEAIRRQIGGGKDIISILSMCICAFCHWHIDFWIWTVEANMEASEEDRMPEDEVLAQVSRIPERYVLADALWTISYRCRAYPLFVRRKSPLT
jgi:hypothetical protein